MSTRGCIARQTGERSFTGVYHHNDSYPSGVGATLFQLYHTVFKKDLPLMLKTLINDHPAGWSTINDVNWKKKPGYVGDRKKRRKFDGTDAPSCYCHGERHEEAQEITENNAASCGCEYAYVFTEGGVMKICSSYNSDGSKMFGMFGFGNPEASWRIIAEVQLEGDEPDWRNLRNRIAA